MHIEAISTKPGDACTLSGMAHAEYLIARGQARRHQTAAEVTTGPTHDTYRLTRSWASGVSTPWLRWREGWARQGARMLGMNQHRRARLAAIRAELRDRGTSLVELVR